MLHFTIILLSNYSKMLPKHEIKSSCHQLDGGGTTVTCYNESLNDFFQFILKKNATILRSSIILAFSLVDLSASVSDSSGLLTLFQPLPTCVSGWWSILPRCSVRYIYPSVHVERCGTCLSSSKQPHTNLRFCAGGCCWNTTVVTLGGTSPWQGRSHHCNV